MQTDLREGGGPRASPIGERDRFDQIPPPDTVVAVIQHAVRTGAETEYEAWLKKITPIAKRFAGHRGIEFIRPPGGSGSYTILLRFDTLGHVQEWLRSDIRRELVEEAKQFFERGEEIDIKTGLEFWFTPPTPAQKQAAPYKQALVTLSVVFPLTILVPWALQPLFQVVPPLGLPGVSNFLVASVIVILMTYVIMPRYTRVIAKWLYG
jgi:antibiotic biosynthesis monooxygenase (ABM) superfamily enzyme